MKKLIFSGLFLALVGMVSVGCKKEKTSPSSTTPTAKVDNEKETILGKRQNNPFTLKNMQEAYASLTKQKSSTVLEANKLYVRFLPRNVEELAILDADSLILSEIPLDAEVTQYGTYYNDPSTLASGTTWLYTTVDVDYAFKSVQYEIIDHLFLPDEADEGEKALGVFSDVSKEELEAKALELAGYSDEALESSEKATKYRPKGYVKVQQNINNVLTPVPVKQLKVRSRWWFYFGSGYTDDNGYFECDNTYRKSRKVSIIFIFENAFVNIRAIKGTQFWGMFFTERKNIGTFSGSSLENIGYTFDDSNDETTDTKRKWMACHAINSVREQRIFCAQTGILAPPPSLNLWLTSANTNGNSMSTFAAAPMLKQMANTSLLVTGSELFLISIGHPWFAVAIEVLSHFPPDITYNYSGFGISAANKYSDQISETFYHELAHASHYNKVGNAYWGIYIVLIIDNGGYGSPSSLGSGRIALSEAWAECCGARFAHLRYGNNFSIGETWFSRIENFTPYTTGGWDWIPEGVMHDLIDEGEPTTTNVVDYVGYYTLAQCFGSMDSDITSVTGYRNRFVLEYGGAQQTAIGMLFKSYGY